MSADHDASFDSEAPPTITDLPDDVLRKIFRNLRYYPTEQARLSTVCRSFHRCLVTDPDPGSHGELEIYLHNQPEMLCRYSRVTLPIQDPAFQHSLDFLFQGARGRRFTTVQCSLENLLAHDSEQRLRLVDALREGGCRGPLLLKSHTWVFDNASNMTDIADLIERCAPLSVVVDHLFVPSSHTDGILVGEEQAWLRLGGLRNVSFGVAYVDYHPGGYSFLAPLIHLIDKLHVSNRESYRGSLAPFASLKSLRSLSLRPSLLSPEDVSPLSALESLTDLEVFGIVPSCWDSFSAAVLKLPLQKIACSFAKQEPGPLFPLCSLPFLALPESLTSLRFEVRWSFGISTPPVDFFRLISSLAELDLCFFIDEGSLLASALQLGSSLGALTALRSLVIGFNSGLKQRRWDLDLPDIFSHLTALTRFKTWGIHDVHMPAEPPTWDPRYRRMEGGKLTYEAPAAQERSPR